jgi:ribonucleoside-diphosphate reductase alpha chain
MLRSVVKIDYSRDSLLDNFSKELIKRHYLLEGEKSPQEAFARTAEYFCLGDIELAQRIYDYVSKKWFMFSSPILSNSNNNKGLPISCFLNYVDDSIQGLNTHTVETRLLSVAGGGVGGHWGNVRSLDNISPGVPGWLHTVDSDMVAYKQGATRRGAYAGYLDINHPDIVEFIKMRTPSGDINRKSLNLHHGVNITDSFLQSVEEDRDFELVDPHSKKVKEIVRARDLWELILTTRFRTGEPYINYLDEANRKLNPYLKDRGLSIKGSNLCNEIHLPTDIGYTAVCCLSSVNIEKYDEWKDTDMVKDLINFLDNVLTIFIDKGHKLPNAVNSAKKERSIGLGAMGFADYLQDKGIPFDSGIAISINRSIFKNIKEQAEEASKERSKSLEEPEYLKGSGRRNAHLLAIAPNANSSIMLGCSASIEPRLSNCYTHKTRVGSHLVKNPKLEKVLHLLNMNTESVWEDIMNNDGSIQHLDFLDESVKEVFKTAYELDQRWVVDMARARQEYVCQGQSINVFFPSGTDKAYLNSVHLRAFSRDTEAIGDPLKGLYYLRTSSGATVEKVSLKVQRDALKDGVAGSTNECLACEG